MATFARFLAAEVLELLMDPGAVEFRGEEFELVEDVRWEIQVEIFGRCAVSDELLWPDKHPRFDEIVEDGAVKVSSVAAGGVL